MGVRLLKFEKKKAFFYHYNKPASLKEGKPMMTVHVGGTCYLAPALDVKVNSTSRTRKTQPHVVMVGKCEGLYITDNLITIY